MSDPFLGEIRIFGGTYAPAGWAACNGALLPISQNDALYTLFGTTFGGDGINNFGVPNLWGRVPIHDGTGPGLSPYINGALGGTESVTLLDAHHPAHTHAFSADTDPGTQPGLKGNVLGAPAGTAIYYQGLPISALGKDALAAAPGQNKPHENRMPSLAINYIVALAGIFPSQG
jgi:microcystin-dependent protein